MMSESSKRLHIVVFNHVQRDFTRILKITVKKEKRFEGSTVTVQVQK